MIHTESSKMQPLIHLCLFLALAGICSGDALRRARQGLAGAKQQYEERWKAVQERFNNDGDFMVLVKREKKKRDHFLSYFPIDPNNATSVEKQAILMRDNSKWLNGMLANPATPSDPAGVYWEGLGNSLRIEKIGGKYYFAIRKYDSSHGHQGKVAGVLDEWKDGRSVFRGDFSSEGNTGTIQFELRNGLLITTTSGSIKSIGGQRASFAGVYSRVSALKKRDHRLIREGLQSDGPLGFESPFKNLTQPGAHDSSGKEQALSQRDMTINAIKSYQELDAALQRIYEEILVLYSDDEEFLVFFKRSQQAWIKYRDAHINAIWPAIETESRRLGTAERMSIPMELEEPTRQRIAVLLTWRQGIEEGYVGSGTRMTPESIKKREQLPKINGR